MEKITQLLRDRLEGKCSKHGYILRESIVLQDVSMGMAQHEWLNGDFAFQVRFRAQVCDVTPGAVVKARVVNTNRFGLLAEAGGGATASATAATRSTPGKAGTPRDSRSGPAFVDIVVTKQSVGFQSDVDLESVSVNDWVYVEIIGRRCELGEPRITAIGRVVQGPKPNGVANTMTTEKGSANTTVLDTIEAHVVVPDDDDGSTVASDGGGDADMDGVSVSSLEDSAPPIRARVDDDAAMAATDGITVNSEDEEDNDDDLASSIPFADEEEDDDGTAAESYGPEDEDDLDVLVDTGFEDF
jgi:hypothetical protein